MIPEKYDTLVQLLRSTYKIGLNESESIQSVAITLLANTALQHIGHEVCNRYNSAGL